MIMTSVSETSSPVTRVHKTSEGVLMLTARYLHYLDNDPPTHQDILIIDHLENY